MWGIVLVVPPDRGANLHAKLLWREGEIVDLHRGIGSPRWGDWNHGHPGEDCDLKGSGNEQAALHHGLHCVHISTLALQRCVNDGETLLATSERHVGDAEHVAKLAVINLHRSRRWGGTWRRLRECC